MAINSGWAGFRQINRQTSESNQEKNFDSVLKAFYPAFSLFISSTEIRKSKPKKTERMCPSHSMRKICRSFSSHLLSKKKNIPDALRSLHFDPSVCLYYKKTYTLLLVDVIKWWSSIIIKWNLNGQSFIRIFYHNFISIKKMLGIQLILKRKIRHPFHRKLN